MSTTRLAAVVMAAALSGGAPWAHATSDPPCGMIQSEAGDAFDAIRGLPRPGLSTTTQEGLALLDVIESSEASSDPFSIPRSCGERLPDGERVNEHHAWGTPRAEKRALLTLTALTLAALGALFIARPWRVRAAAVKPQADER